MGRKFRNNFGNRMSLLCMASNSVCVQMLAPLADWGRQRETGWHWPSVKSQCLVTSDSV